MFILLGTLTILHLLILTQQIPYDKVWGGRISSVEEMQFLETLSILLNLFMLFILIIKYKQLQLGKKNKMIDIFIWGFCGFFILNTIGNLFADSKLELILGTTLTFSLSVLCFVVAKSEKRKRI
jgi:hypothetical protein